MGIKEGFSIIKMLLIWAFALESHPPPLNGKQLVLSECQGEAGKEKKQELVRKPTTPICRRSYFLLTFELHYMLIVIHCTK